MNPLESRPLASLMAALGVSILSACGFGDDELELAGTLERKMLELAAPISEVITAEPLAIGDRIEAQQIVVQLDTEVADAELRAYEAAHAAVSAAHAEAENEYRRIDDLRRAKVSTPQALDAAQRTRDETLALVAEKEARIVQAKKRLRDLTIRSYAAGVLDQLPFEIGERVPAGGVVAVVIADENPWIRVWMPARAVARLRPGSPAKVKVEGLDEWFAGKVKSVSREPEFTPHYALTERESAHLVYEARIGLEGAHESLRPGLPARVRLAMGRE